MRKARKEFTPAQKANIFVHDRATCCFSGANLWLLDAPLRPGYQRDWVDHVKPSARGGASDEDNGVCASHTLNAKKRHNSADTTYLFLHGRPTRLYFDLFGPISTYQSQRLARLSRLQPADWYFNRAIGQVLLAFDYLVEEKELKWGNNPQRKDDHWLGAALKSLKNFQRFVDGILLESRGIVSRPDRFQRCWLNLRRPISTHRELERCIAPLYRTYRANALIWNRYFWESETPKQRLSVVRLAERRTDLTHDALKCIRDDYKRRKEGS